MAEDAGRPPSRPAARQALHLPPHHRFRAARRRPKVRRGQGDHRRPRPLPRRSGCDPRRRRRARTRRPASSTISGMARPEGYRKAVRVMEIADRFGMPVLSLVDTAGAYPGVDAEARGQAEAIARSTEACLKLGRRTLRSSSARGGRAARSRSQPQTASTCSNTPSTASSRRKAPPQSSGAIRHGAQDAATAMKITATDLLEPEDHRRDRRGAARRGASRSREGDRPRRRGHRRGAEGPCGPRARRISSGSAARNSSPSAGRFSRKCR